MVRIPVVAAAACGLLGLALLVFALRDATWARAGRAMGYLDGWAVVAILALSVASFGAQVARWRVFVSAADRAVPWHVLASYRLAAWGINYVTPGVQVGGEVLRVAALERRLGVPRGAAVTTVLLDKLVELATSLVVLLVSVAATGGVGLVRAGHGEIAVTFAAVAILAVGLALRAVARGRRPVARGTATLGQLFSQCPFLVKPRLRLLRVVARGERSFAKLVARSPGIALKSIAASLASWLFLLAGYAVICGSLGARLAPLQTLAALAVTHVALQLAPVPGGLGALEASHIAVFASFGVAPSTALMVAVVIRGRDTLFAAAGLLLAVRNAPVLVAGGSARPARRGSSA